MKRPVKPEPDDPASRDTSSLERMIGVLDLFEGAPRLWTFDEIHARLGHTRSTLYRYLKILTDAELLTLLPGHGYSFGPRIAELDYSMRTHDPLIAASRPVMRELAAEVPGIALLCRRYRDRVLCVHQEQSDIALRTAYERGRALPLLRGAASRVILAYLPPARWTKLRAEHPEEFADAGLGHTVEEVRAVLRRIRADGFDITTEQMTIGVTGIAAPLFDARRNVLGSLSLTVQRKSIGADDIRRIAGQVMFGAGIVSKTVS